MNGEVQRLVQDELKFTLKLVVLEYARECGNNVKSWREFEVSTSTFYLWKKAYEREGRAGLKSCNGEKAFPSRNIVCSIHIAALFPLLQASDKIGPGTDSRAVAMLPLL